MILAQFHVYSFKDYRANKTKMQFSLTYLSVITKLYNKHQKTNSLIEIADTNMAAYIIPQNLHNLKFCKEKIN